MPSKGFVKPIGEDLRLHLNWKWDKGEILSFCISLEAMIEDEFREVCRYDTSHGFFHLDQFYKSGGKEKRIIEIASLKAAFEFAEQDLIKNWRKYVERYKNG